MSFERFAATCAILAAVSGFLYSVAFVILHSVLLSALFLMADGVLAMPVLLAVYMRLRESEPAFALLALLLGVAGSMGATLHGGYDLANALNPPAADPLAVAGLPSQIDPRGLLTFGVAGLGAVVAGWLMVRTGLFPTGLGYVSLLLGCLLMLVYLGRLIVLDPSNPLLLVPAVLTGFVVNPAWYVWIALELGWVGELTPEQD